MYFFIVKAIAGAIIGQSTNAGLEKLKWVYGFIRRLTSVIIEQRKDTI